MTTAKKWALLAAALVLLVAIVVLSAWIMRLEEGLKQGLTGEAYCSPLLDGCKKGYTPDEVDERLRAWKADPPGNRIATYRRIHQGPDLVFPLVYCAFFFVLARLGVECLGLRWRFWPLVLIVLPLANMVADYAENYLITWVILTAAGDSDPDVVKQASLATVTKWILVVVNLFVSWGLVLAGWARCLLRHGPTP
jgi:hypothetical protein